MKNALLVFLFLFSFFPIHALGKWHDMQGNTLEDTEWMKSSDDFGAQLLLVGNEEEFLKRWETPSKIFNTKTISEIKRGEPFITPIIFSGCYTNSDGNCIVTTDITVLRPDGTSYADQPDIEIWKNKPPPPKGILGLGVGYLKIIIEPEDPDGTYEVKAKVNDVVNESSFILVQEFNVRSNSEPAEQKRTMPDEALVKELSQWLTFYYQNPHEEGDESNIKKLFEGGFFDKPSSVAPLIMFLAEVFRLNESKLPVWTKTFHQVPKKQSRYLLQGLWESNTHTAKKIIQEWPHSELKETISSIQRTQPVDLKNIPIKSPDTLDMLWGAFMASGNAQYVERIISVLSYPTDSTNREERLANMLLVGAAKWSLSSNAVQHEAVLKTCKRFSESENPRIKQGIVEVLEKANETKAQQQNAAYWRPRGASKSVLLAGAL